MDVVFFAPVVIRAIGVDANDPNTKFFDRYIEPNFGNTNSIDITMPLSPNKLEILFVNQTNNDDNAFSLQGIEADYLTPIGVDLTRNHYNTVLWFQKFCRDASFLPDGIYRELGGNLWINYMTQITENGQILDTPARVHHDTGEIQINSTKFRTYTIPQRFVILCHEDSHHRWDNTDETFCDMEALRIALGLGFPKSECIYSFTDILSDTHQNRSRMNQIVNYINRF